MSRIKDVKTSPLLLILVVTFVGFLMMSNILANQMLNFFGLTIDAATLTFSVTYILSDVFSEVYGYKWSRRVTWMAAALSLIFGLLILLVTHLPQPDWYDGSHFALGVGGSLRIVLASCVAFVAGDFVNDRIFRQMKKKHQGDLKGFSWRAIFSSIGGSIVDTTIFVFIAFTFVVPFNEMIPMILISVVLKTAYELLILPVTNIVVRKVKAFEGNKVWE